jgi:hypothetical protein
VARRHIWILGTICLAFCFGLSIQASDEQSPFRDAVIKEQTIQEQKVPYVTLNPFESWSPDTIRVGGSSTISISVRASKDLPHDTKVTLNFGFTTSAGMANFAITPTDSRAENAFSFAIGPEETKTVTATYKVESFTGLPRVQAMCEITVAAPAVGSGSPQTSASELWIR